MGFNSAFKGLNAELNPICHLLALLGACPILHISRISFNCLLFVKDIRCSLRGTNRILKYYFDEQQRRDMFWECKGVLEFIRIIFVTGYKTCNVCLHNVTLRRDLATIVAVKRQ